MIVYQTGSSVDPANDDAWHPTLAAAVKHLRETVGVAGPIKLKDGEFEAEVEGAGFVHLTRHEIKPTREDVCDALNRLVAR